MVPQIKPPCGGCDHRKVGCHGRCEEYRGYVSAVEAYKARREAQRAGGLAASAVRRDAIARVGRRLRAEKRRGR